MRAIFRRELRAYFQTSLGYVFLAVLYFFTGYYFLTYNLYNSTTDLSNLFRLLFPVVLFMVPILTMRLMSEDKQSGTDQVLLTSPVSRAGIVLGKYLAALCVYLMGIAATLLCALVIALYSVADWPVYLGHLVGLSLLGAALIAVCMLLSALTQSQVIAALLGFAASLFLFMMDALGAVFRAPTIAWALSLLSFSGRYSPFTYGLLDLSGVLYFVSIAALFLYLCVLILEQRQGG